MMSFEQRLPIFTRGLAGVTDLPAVVYGTRDEKDH